MLKVWKKSWEPFGICLLNSKSNPAHFHQSLAGLAVLFSRQLPNGSHDFFQTFSIFFLDYFIKNPQTTIALPFLTHNMSAIGGVNNAKNDNFDRKNSKQLLHLLLLQIKKVVIFFLQATTNNKGVLNTTPPPLVLLNLEWKYLLIIIKGITIHFSSL